MIHNLFRTWQMKWATPTIATAALATAMAIAVPALSRKIARKTAIRWVACAGTTIAKASIYSACLQESWMPLKDMLISPATPVWLLKVWLAAESGFSVSESDLLVPD